MHGRISVHCCRLFSDMQGRFQLAQHRLNYENASLPTLEELGSRLARLNTNSALLSVLGRLGGDNILGEAPTITCPSLDPPEASEPDESLDVARAAFAR